MRREPRIRWSLIVLAIACTTTTACGEDLGGDREPVDLGSSATVALSTVPTAETGTPEELADSGQPLLDGELMAAWNARDLGGYWEHFASEPTHLGTKITDVNLASYTEGWWAFGWRYRYQDCVETARFAECRMVFVDDFHGPAGIELVGREQFWFDENGLITAYDASGADHEHQQHMEAFEDWLGDTAPDLAQAFTRDDLSPEAWALVLQLVPEFLDQSDVYPLGKDLVVAEPVLVGTIDGVDVYNANPAQLELARWALTRFAEAGLPPPPVTHVTFPPTRACAEGLTGVATHNGSVGSIDVCIAATDFAGGRMPLTGKRTILHELGHVWTIGHTDEATRAQFMAVRGVSSWHAPVWEDSGTEHAAEIIMWALIDADVEPRLPNRTVTELTEAYATLTGRQRPGPGG